jgi:hypothetical protein
VAAPTAGATISAKPVVVASPSASPSPLLKPIGELPPAQGALAAIETRSQAQDPSFLTPVEILFQFEQPIATSDALRMVVNGVQALPGVAAVKSNGVNIIVQYDTARVQPPQIRQYLDGLGYALAPGTDIPDAGTAAD